LIFGLRSWPQPLFFPKCFPSVSQTGRAVARAAEHEATLLSLMGRAYSQKGDAIRAAGCYAGEVPD